MKFIISPSKTQKIKLNDTFDTSTPIFNKMAKTINTLLKKYDPLQLKSIFKVSDNIALMTYNNIQSFDTTKSGHAIFSYTGLVFKEIQANTLTYEQIRYLNDNLLILSAYYGVLKPLDLIKPYRLDYKTTIDDLDLASIWNDKINAYLDCDVIVNLASKEFSCRINKDMIHIEFKELRNNKFRVISTNAKMARGKLVHMIAKNKIDTTHDLKRLEVHGYNFNDQLSEKFNYVFTK